MLGVGGSITAMVTSLKNNSALVSKTRGLKRLRQQLNNASAPRKTLQFKSIDPAKVKKTQTEILERFRAERKRNNLIIGSIGMLLLILMVLLTRFIIFFPAPTEEIDGVLREQQGLAKEKREKEEFAFYIEDGYHWLSKNNFTNALHQFQLAVEQRPNSYDAQKGLTLALIKQCSVAQVECEKAKLQYLIWEKKMGKKNNISNEVTNYLMALGDTLMANKFTE